MIKKQKVNPNAIAYPEVTGWTWIGNSSKETADEAVRGYQVAFPEYKKLRAVKFVVPDTKIKFAVYMKA